LERLIKDVGDNGIVEFRPRQEGNTLHLILAPKKAVTQEKKPKAPKAAQPQQAKPPQQSAPRPQPPTQPARVSFKFLRVVIPTEAVASRSAATAKWRDLL